MVGWVVRMPDMVGSATGEQTVAVDVAPADG